MKQGPGTPWKDQYRGVSGISVGTRQSPTAFRKQMNVNPTPAQAVLVNHQTCVPETYTFL